ncbi:hypothetical protein EXIGLDRAFT_721269 [Exidia glandulosa HHB12029]|uniref:Pyridoxamine 5'-phosphate oxidase Alr4036 family FMN-binding domain-containing protein n=1 Tax=Exidia glandulosa HHB12029 TaxID=1314781 RepID=A0A165NBB7_EXIGL|nr:hypothetical protein EXIGLDRAFT_721269 [Exidia glandulosa HHB12029]
MSAGWLARLTQALSKHPSSNTYSLATVEDKIPRVRTVVHRTFLGQDTPAPLLVTTTDVRTPKSAQIADNWNTEICWWIEPTQEQWRITGNALLVPHSKHTGRIGELPPGYDWTEERQRTFNTVSGRIRASFCRPVPGTSLEPGTTWPEQLPPLGEWKNDVEREQVETAFENFALLVICPLEVDFVELKPIPNIRTTYAIHDGKWEERAVVP